VSTETNQGLHWAGFEELRKNWGWIVALGI
jgi:hypothetical protein